MFKWLVQRMQMPDATPAGSAVRASGIEDVPDDLTGIRRHRRTKKVHMKQALPEHHRQTQFLMVGLGALLILCAIATLIFLNRAQLDNNAHRSNAGAGPVNFYP